MDLSPDSSDDPNRIAALKADKRTDLQFDFDLEDIIAGNRPESDVGRQLAALVDDFQGMPTQGKVEAALLPLYEAMLTDNFREEGGNGPPPMANRHAVRQHAVKVMQARKVKRVAIARQVRGPQKPKNSNYTPLPQLIIIGGLLVVIAAVIYWR